VLNSLLNFISINTPIAKTNTLSVILEDILEAIEKQLRAKDIRIARRCEKDLPETNGNRPKTLITVRFPIERRKVVYYAPITL
jgi:hypothetical protein